MQAQTMMRRADPTRFACIARALLLHTYTADAYARTRATNMAGKHAGSDGTVAQVMACQIPVL